MTTTNGVSQRPRSLDEPSEISMPERGGANDEKKAAPAVETRTPATAALVAGHARGRIDAARKELSTLAAAIPRHGVNLDRLAHQSASRANGPGQARAMARESFVRTALTQNPDLAARAIAVRLQGTAATEREIVAQVVGRSGTSGLQRYAIAERTLATLREFQPEEQKDILGMMRAGESFERAVKLERQELTRAAAEPGKPSLAAQRGQAVSRARTAAARLRSEGASLHREFLAIPRLNRFGEAAVGTILATGAVGSVAWAGVKSVATVDSAHLSKAVDGLETAGGYMAGELSAKVDSARARYLQFTRDDARVHELAGKFARAIESSDHRAVADTTKALDAAIAKRARSAQSLGAAVKSLSKATRDFDSAAVDAAVAVVVAGAATCLQLGLAKDGATLATRSVGRLAAEVVKSVPGETAQAAVNDVIGAARKSRQTVER